ncbi:MAG: hypothetical protein PHF29_09605 [Candidatus Riflebacteria bacterium]|nr:hypothetical protein [Candidatus Riflebacteria bacterium]
MSKLLYVRLFFLAFVLSFLPNYLTAENLPVIIAYEIERKGNFLEEPGNNPYEVLRRFGRAINKNQNLESENQISASLFDFKKINQKDFLKPVLENNLSKEQIKAAKELISKYEQDFNLLISENTDEQEAIIVKIAFESKQISELIDNALNESSETKNKLSENEKEQIRLRILPFIENSDYFVGIFSASNNGFFSNMKLVSRNNEFPEARNNISISDFVNRDSLAHIVQHHGINDVENNYLELKKIPQTELIELTLSNAGLSLKDDILKNMANESITYINLEPSGSGGLPDIRIVAPIPDIKALKANLPKLKQLCVQTGLFTEIKEEKFTSVKLSFFMFPHIAIYTGLIDNFLIIATGYDNLIKEMNFVNNVQKNKINKDRISLAKYKKYIKINFDNFNTQLQRLLQSPLLQNKGIPPLPNLNFLNDLTNLTGTFEITPSEAVIRIDVPIKQIKK